MRSQILFGALFVSLMVGVLGYRWAPFELECAEELNIARSTIETLNTPVAKQSPEDNADLNEFLECTWKKQGTQKANGEIDWDRMHEVLKVMFKNKPGDESYSAEKTARAAIVKDSVTECQNKNIHGETPGQTVAKVQNCIGTLIREKWADFVKNKTV